MQRPIILPLFILYTMFGFGQVESKKFDLLLKTILSHSVNEVYVDQVDDDDSTTVFLDAREKAEYAVSHIKNAIWVGYDDFDLNRVAEVDKNKKVIVYCSIGYRSEKVGEKLTIAGYKNVSNLYGSIFEWVNQDKPVYDLDGNITEKIHAYDKVWGIWLNKGKKVYK